ncbi:hypothetical protein [Desulfosediminicola flagellatus]|uniref:hypothetical protein n=1 Tax=Desulfosediminicola flagellatus TaxID=2569541 RepID=UPI0010ABF3AC|nr:hypothetical protein [Desulfosediminicola flagellatus]
MKKKYAVAAVAMASVIFVGFPQQSKAGETLGVGVHLGTLGPGAEISFSVLENTRFRVGLNYLDFSLDGESNDVDYDFDTKLRSFSLLLDYHPFSSAFFLSGGAYINNNEVGVVGTFDAGEVPGSLSPYLETAKVLADVGFNTFAPYFGIGWRSNNGTTGWDIACNFGVMFQGAPDVKNMRVEGPIDVNGISDVQDYLANEEKEIEDDLSWFEYYPVASVQFVYHF